jgi:PKD repeat protein
MIYFSGGVMSFLKKIISLFFAFMMISNFLFPQNQANCLATKKTATWCSGCPEAAALFKEIRDTHGNRVPMIAWHPNDNDPFSTPFTDYWCKAIAQMGYPMMWADHVYQVLAANAIIKTHVNTRLGVSRALHISVSAGQSAGSITIRNDSTAAVSGNILAVIVERHIRYNWVGETELDFVARLNCYTDHLGKAISIPAGKTVTENVSYNLSTIPYPAGASPGSGGAQFELVAFVFNPSSKEVFQAALGVVGTQPGCDLTANFSHDATSSSLLVNFTDTSTDSCHTVVGWTWNFGDGSNSTLKNPTRTYTNPGNYSVTLTVRNNASPAITASTTKTIAVGEVQPTYCASQGNDFSYFWISKVDLGTLANSSAGSGYFDYTATVAPPVLKIGQSYNLTITLNSAQYSNWFKAYIDFNRDGDFEDAGEVIFVSAAASKIISDGGSITIPANAVPGFTRLRVQIKNATSSNLPAPEPCETFAYGEVEDYKVKIETIDCPDPTANFNYSSLGNYTVQFTDMSDPGQGATIASWKWGFGPYPYLGTSTLQHPQFTFPSAGFYPCCVDVVNNCGKTSGICMAVEVPEIPASLDDIIGVFPSVGGLWKMEKSGSAFNWTQLSKQEPDMIRMGDVDGNGLDDLGCFFKTNQKFWIRYDNGTWADIPASAKDMICFDLGDINHDEKADIVGSWTFGTWWKNTATGVWTKLSNLSPSYLAVGDFDGDGYGDIVGLYPTLASLWIYKYNGATWTRISNQINLNDLRCGDFDNDGNDEVLGSFNIGTWTFNPTSNVWVKHSSNQASVLCAGDINGLGKDDIIGDWSPIVPGLWIKYLEDSSWIQTSKQIPKDITSGKTK